MTDSMTVLPGMAKRIGVAADHGGFELKQELVRMLRQAGYEVGDYGDSQPDRRMTIRILSCPWPVQSPAGQWIAGWPSAAVAWGHVLPPTRCRAYVQA